MGLTACATVGPITLRVWDDYRTGLPAENIIRLRCGYRLCSITSLPRVIIGPKRADIRTSIMYLIGLSDNMSSFGE